MSGTYGLTYDVPPIVGVGTCPSEFMIIGIGPGYAEADEGRAFVGRGSRDVHRFFDGTHRPRFDDCYATNLYKVYGGKDYHYTVADLQRDEPLLIEEIDACQPKIIITMGREPTRWFLGDVDMDGVQGIAWYATRPGYEHIIIFPVIHPAAAFKNPEMSPYVIDGMHSLELFLDGEFEARHLFDDPFAGQEVYEEITSERDLRRVLAILVPGSSVHVDTEGWPWAGWSLQFSPSAGTGYLIRATRRELLARFVATIRAKAIRLTYHSALHELQMGRTLGIPLHDIPFDDTMIMAYLLQLEPQGLKPSTLRHCGMEMSDFTDVMGDVSNDLARDWLTWVYDGEQFALEERQEAEYNRLCNTPYQDKKGKWKPGRKLKVHPKLPKSQLQKAVERCLKSDRPRGLWEDQIEDVQVAGYKAMGEMPLATLDYVAPEIAIPYGCRDADGTGRLLPHYERKIDALGLRETYNLELSTYPLIDRMSMIGVLPDLDHFKDLSGILQTEIEELAAGLAQQTSIATFNANSGDQVAEYLFETLGLESLKNTDSGRGSTNDKILEALEKEQGHVYPVIADIRKYRETYKLKNTFVDRMPDFVQRWPFDGRIHATFRTTRVITGRLAASDPNLLAQPEHGPWAKDFKRGWIAAPGHVLCAWDESQVELRGLAHLSQDPVLLAVYRGEMRNPDGSMIDLHAKLAQRIFGGDIAQYMHKCLGRLAAKAINFGIPMGMTCKGLSVELRKNGVDADEATAQQWLDETLNLYAGVKEYMAYRIAEVRRQGYVRCMSGRLRYIGGIRSIDPRVREEAERFAFSTPIQESATFIMKQAEAIVWQDVLPYFWKRGDYVEPILQVHDCLKMEADEDVAQELNLFMTEAMTNVPKGFSVPLAVEGEYGYNMQDVKGF